jgi:hypothetical protein
MKTGAAILIAILLAFSTASGTIVAPDEVLRIVDSIVEDVASYTHANPEAPGAFSAWSGEDLSVESPVLVHTFPELEPCYYLVIVNDEARETRSFISIGADNGSVQVYGLTGPGRRFDTTRETASKRALARLGSQVSRDEFICVSAPDKNVYWFARPSGDHYAEDVFVNLNNADDVRRSLPVAASPPWPTRRRPTHSGSIFERASQGGPASSPAKPMTSPDSYSIFRVPYHVQITDYNCGPASSQMVFDYWGPDINQTDIAHVVDCTNPWGTGTEEMRRGGHFSLISSAIQDTGLHGYHPRPLGYTSVEHWWDAPPDLDTRYSDLKELVSSDYPVLLLTWYDYDHETGHYRVIKGYDDNTGVFIVHDPWMTAGPNLHFDQEYFVDDLWVYSGRWGLFMAPLRVAVSAPEYVLPDEVFEVTAHVSYEGPHPFEGEDHLSNAAAWISIPSGFSLAGGESKSKSLPAISYTGTADSVSWQVVAGSNAGSGSFDVTAKGSITDYCWVYGTYSDSLGGEGNYDATIIEPVQFAEYANSEVTGNGDALIDPGEEHDLTPWLYNLGPNLTSVSGALSSADPQVSVSVDFASFGDISSGDSASSTTPYRFSVGEACSTDAVEFILDVSAGGVSGLDVFYVGLSDSLDFYRWDHYEVGSQYADQWHLSEDRNHTPGGILSWKCGGEAGDDYAPLLDSAVESTPFVIPEGTPVILSFWHWLDAENMNSSVAWDGALIEISRDGGQWQQITPIGGYTHVIHYSCANPLPGGTPCFSGSHGWEYVEANLGFYPGTARVRFRFCSDSMNGEEGWYIDDVRIGTTSAEWLDVTIDPLGDADEGFGVAWADYDDDGRLDIYLTNYATPNKLFHNDGGGFFSDVTSPPMDNPSNGYGAAWADYDNDGDVDLYLANNGNSNRLYENSGGSFSDVTMSPIDDLGYGHCVSWGDYDQDGDVDLYLSNGGGNKLFRNSDGTFEDVTSGYLGDTGWSEGVGWADYDNDGDLDLYIVNYNTSNRMLRNDGGTFSDATTGPLSDTGWGKGLAWGDYDNDGDLDLYLVNEGPNLLLRNDGEGTFTDVTSGALGDEGWGRGVSWLDYDNDADLDLFIANYGTGNKLLRNDDGSFADATTLPMGEADYAQGASFADYDCDGDLDVYIAVRSARNKLLNNNLSNGNHWLHLDLSGTISNASAIGARVRLATGGKWQTREISSGSGFCTQNSLVTEFGLGSYASADTVEISWPSGLVERLVDVAADTVLSLVEGATGAGKISEAPTRYAAHVNFPNPFNPATVIVYDLAAEQEVELRIYSVSGRLVRNLVEGLSHEPGRHTITWDGRDNSGHEVSSGVYFYRIDAGPLKKARKMVLLR